MSSNLKNSGKPSVDYKKGSGMLLLVNGRLELTIEAGRIINPCRIRDLESERMYADCKYIWTNGKSLVADEEPVIKRDSDGSCAVRLIGRMGPVLAELSYTAPAGEPDVILESIMISNPSRGRIDTSCFKCGFGKRIKENSVSVPDISELRFCPIPYRSGTNGKPEDIAYAALYLTSDEAGYVTGSILTVDGGWTCGFARDF